MPMPFPELLAPAGDLERLQTALAYGADAVYLGGEDLSLRARAKGFGIHALEQALDITCPAGTRTYYCLNLLAREEHLSRVRARLDELAGLPLDGLIVADPGVLDLARTHLPHLPIHLSTQANTANSAAVRFWRDSGVKRINLARELDLRSIRAIRRTVPDVELEMFVHGAQCMAVSGRCLMSAWLNDRSANLGECTHPCRFDYRPMALEEAQRKGKATWEVEPGEEFDAVLAAEDLCLVKYLPWMVRQGLSALKIEGRNKTAPHLARVLDVYRTALDDVRSKRFRPQRYLSELSLSATRPLGTGFFLPGKRKILAAPPPAVERTPLLARIVARETGDRWRIAVKHRWQSSTNVAVLKPGLQRPTITASAYTLENDLGERLQTVHSGMTAFLRCDRPELNVHLFLQPA